MHLSRRLPRDQSVYKHCGTTGVKRFVTRLFQNVRIGLVAIQQMAFKSASISRLTKGKGKVFPYSLPSVGPGADPGVQAVSPQVT